MTKAYKSIRQGLIEAIDFAQGKPGGAVVHRVEVPTAASPPDRRGQPLKLRSS